jgi:FixJ family two-component response regulator
MNDRSALIVVVDDDPGMGLALARLLSAAGYCARVFDSAEAVQASGLANVADGLVLDVRLPGLGGPAWYATLVPPRPPAVFITARDGPAVRRTVQAAGGRACLAKPFDGATLLDLLARAVRRRPSGA